MRTIVKLIVALVVIGGAILAYLYFGKDWAFFEESVSEVKARYAPRLAEKREQLKRLVGKLPPPGAMPETKGPITLEPPLGPDPKTRRRLNYTAAMDFECLDPDDTSHVLAHDSPKFRGVISGGERLVDTIRNMRQWENDIYGRTRGAWKAQRTEEVLDIPYLVIGRTVSYTKPVVFPEQKTFLPGEVDVEAFVFDLRDDTLKACVRVKTRNASDKIAVRVDALRYDGVSGLEGELRNQVQKETEQKLLALTPARP